MKSFKYLTKPNSNSLLDKYNYEELKNKIIIQSSKYNDVKLFETVMDFIEFDKQLIDKIYNEIIFYDDIQKFKLDIDIKKETYDKIYIDKKLNILNLLNDCINVVFRIINCKKFKWYIFDSSDDCLKIISKHVIFDFYISNSSESKMLYDEMIYILSPSEFLDYLLPFIY